MACKAQFFSADVAPYLEFLGNAKIKPPPTFKDQQNHVSVVSSHTLYRFGRFVAADAPYSGLVSVPTSS